MFSYILRRLLQFIPTFLLATLLCFIIMQAAPGDFLSTLKANPRISPVQIEMLREQFSLDQNVFVQYFRWLSNFVQGNMGISFSANRPVIELLIPRMLNSLILVLVSTVLLFIIAIPIGIYSARKPYSLGDRIFTTFSYIGLGVPSFFFALLAVFAIVKLKQDFGWEIPIGGKTSSDLPENASKWTVFWDVAKHAAIPSIILVLRGISSESRFIRGQMLETLGQDFIRTAKSKGLSDRVVTYRHAFRIAIIPFIAGLGGLLPALVSGGGFVEYVFNWPGLTPFVLDAINNQDVMVIASTTALSTILYMLGNLIADVLLAVVDPRISYQ